MVLYLLQITADSRNVRSIQPMGGCDDPSFALYFKMLCENCGEVTRKETSICLENVVPKPKHLYGRATVRKEKVLKHTYSRVRELTNLAQRCKGCDRVGSVTIVPGSGRTLTGKDCEEGKFAPLMTIDCKGFMPLDSVFIGPQWCIESESGAVFNHVDLLRGHWHNHDEAGTPLSIDKLRSRYLVIRKGLPHSYKPSSLGFLI